MTRLRQAALLLPSLPRAIRWRSIPLSALVGVGLLELWGAGPAGYRLAALVLCLGTAFVLEDAAAATVASVPAPLLFRRALRLGLGLGLVAASWEGLLWYGHAAQPWRPTLELAAMVAVTLAVAASFEGVVAASVLLTLFGAAWLLPDRFSLFDGSAAGDRQWWLIVAGGLGGFLYGSLDPGRRRFAARMRPRPPLPPSTKARVGHQPR